MFAARGLSYPIDRASIKEPSPVSEDEEEGEWDKAEGIYEAISEITPGHCEVVKDGHLPDDGFTSRAAKAVEASGHWCSSPDVQAMEEEVREYLLTGKSFVGGGDPDEGGREIGKSSQRTRTPSSTRSSSGRRGRRRTRGRYLLSTKRWGARYDIISPTS